MIVITSDRSPEAKAMFVDTIEEPIQSSIYKLLTLYNPSGMSDNPLDAIKSGIVMGKLNGDVQYSYENLVHKVDFNSSDGTKLQISFGRDEHGLNIIGSDKTKIEEIYLNKIGRYLPDLSIRCNIPYSGICPSNSGIVTFKFTAGENLKYHQILDIQQFVHKYELSLVLFISIYNNDWVLGIRTLDDPDFTNWILPTVTRERNILKSNYRGFLGYHPEGMHIPRDHYKPDHIVGIECNPKTIGIAIDRLHEWIKWIEQNEYTVIRDEETQSPFLVKKKPEETNSIKEMKLFRWFDSDYEVVVMAHNVDEARETVLRIDGGYNKKVTALVQSDPIITYTPVGLVFIR